MNAIKRSNKIALVLSIILSILFLVPLLWMFLTSFKSLSESIGSSALLPKNWTMENYHSLLVDSQDAPMIRWLMNTAFVTLVGTVIVVVVDIMAAYALARLRLPLKQLFLYLIIFSLTIPGIVNLFPNFFIMKNLNLIDTYIPLMLVYAASSMGVFLIYNFLINFPIQLEEAAIIDGANTWQIFFHVVLPSIKPPVATLAVMTFLAIYNDFLWPSLVTNDINMKTVTVGVANLVQGSNFVNPGRMMAATVIATVPSLLIFLYANKFFIGSNSQSGIK
ncbi:carbohydrate ABC transporter permease [Aerococcaceae bacterium zg-BR22]|uniref:carbohydrate ABC transporter permease n=1 Tax=Aerococcaceae bacterium zg-1292 TaxID=2774330 RepID=UPI0040649096|nr:carbohydrate ABC transporter permease [Aerococcaceae bacterium zg-BR22]